MLGWQQRQRGWKPRLLRLMRSIVFIYVCFMVALFFLQRRMLFPRHFVHAPSGVRSTRLTIDSEAGIQKAWLLRGRGVDASHPGPAVIFAHGNGELAEDWIDAMAIYQSLGVTVLLPEYRGYGGSPGAPSQATLTTDFVHFFDALAARPEVDQKRIIIHGRSVGGGVACALAHERPPAALILQSTFSSVTQFAKRYLAPSFLVRDPFDNARVVEELHAPIFIAHGTHDGVIPFKHALELHRRAPQAKFVTYNTDHNDCPPDWIEYMNEVAAFLTDAGILQAPTANR